MIAFCSRSIRSERTFSRVGGRTFAASVLLAGHAVLSPEIEAQATTTAAGTVDSAKVDSVKMALAAVPQTVEAARREVGAVANKPSTSPGVVVAQQRLLDGRIQLVRHAGKLMTQVEVGAKASNAILSAFNFGLTLGWTGNPLASPTLVSKYDRYLGRALDFAAPLAYGLSLRFTDNKGAQLNTLAISLAATQGIKLFTNRDNTRVAKAEAALKTFAAVADYLDFNRLVYADSRKIANAAETARKADSTLATDISAFMTRYGDFPLQVSDEQVSSSPAFTKYIGEAVPLIERFQRQITRTQDFYVLASGAVEAYEKHPVARSVMGDLSVSDSVPAPPPTARALAADAKAILTKLRTAGTRAQADWDELRKLLDISPSRVSSLMEFETLTQLAESLK